MEEETTICHCNFQQLLFQLLHEIKTDNMKSVTNFNHEQLTMILHIAAFLSSSIFGVHSKIIKLYLKEFPVNINIKTSTSYYNLNLRYNKEIHKYGLNGLSFVLNKMLKMEKSHIGDTNFDINWKNVIQEIIFFSDEQLIKNNMMLSIDIFLGNNYKSQNVDNFLTFYKKIFNLVFSNKEKLININYSKYIKKYNITENVIMEMLSYCQRNCLEANFIVEFFCLIVKIYETSNGIGINQTYGGGNKRTNPDTFTHCAYKVYKFNFFHTQTDF